MQSTDLSNQLLDKIKRGVYYGQLNCTTNHIHIELKALLCLSVTPGN